jgi:hypothetical protein
MDFILNQLLKAAIRIEKKLDETLILLRRLAKTQEAVGLTMLQPLSNPGQNPCPLCQKRVVYQPVVLPTQEMVTIRICGCEPVVTELPVDLAGKE